MYKRQASGRYSHLAFATFDFEHDEFWDLVDFAADHGWTSNSFYTVSYTHLCWTMWIPATRQAKRHARSTDLSMSGNWRI